MAHNATMSTAHTSPVAVHPSIDLIMLIRFKGEQETHLVLLTRPETAAATVGHPHSSFHPPLAITPLLGTTSNPVRIMVEWLSRRNTRLISCQYICIRTCKFLPMNQSKIHFLVVRFLGPPSMTDQRNINFLLISMHWIAKRAIVVKPRKMIK